MVGHTAWRSMQHRMTDRPAGLERPLQTPSTVYTVRQPMLETPHNVRRTGPSRRCSSRTRGRSPRARRRWPGRHRSPRGRPWCAARRAPEAEAPSLAFRWRRAALWSPLAGGAPTWLPNWGVDKSKQFGRALCWNKAVCLGSIPSERSRARCRHQAANLGFVRQAARNGARRTRADGGSRWCAHPPHRRIVAACVARHAVEGRRALHRRRVQRPLLLQRRQVVRLAPVCLGTGTEELFQWPLMSNGDSFYISLVGR